MLGRRFGNVAAMFVVACIVSGPAGSRALGDESTSEIADVDAVMPTDNTLSIGIVATARVVRWSLPGYSEMVLEFQRTAAVAEETYVASFATDTIGMTPVDRASRYEVTVTMPEGASRVTRTVEVPIFGVPDTVRWTLARLGQPVPPGYETALATPYARFPSKPDRLWIGREAQLRWSISGDANPDASRRADWSLGDVVEVSADSVSSVAEDDARWGQLRRFLMAGGLVVTSDLKTVEPLTRRLKVEPFTVREDLNLGATAFNSGIPLAFSAPVDGGTDSNYWQVSVGAGKILKVPSGSLLDDRRRANVRNFAPEHCVATLARGVEPMLGDGRFQDWTVPGVAQPPVYTFMGLLAAFVILVGPVAYRRTTRNGRGYLMFLIAPVLAAVTTTAMFAYGVVADGFGTKARIRQITFVDGQTGEATERTRATYFAGIRPRGGLSFAAGREVYPYPQGGDRVWRWNTDEVPEQVDSIRSTGDGFKLGPGYLPSRRQRQFVEFAHREGIGKLHLKEFNPVVNATKDGPDPTSSTSGFRVPEVTNGFGFDLQRLIVRDSRGVYWMLPELKVDQTAPLLNIPADTRVTSMIGGMYNDYRPLSEIRIAKGGPLSNRQLRDLVAVLNKEVNTRQVVYEGALETLLANMMKNDNDLPPSFFVAWSDVSDDVVAVENAELIESIRFVFGTTSR